MYTFPTHHSDALLACPKVCDVIASFCLPRHHMTGAWTAAGGRGAFDQRRSTWLDTTRTAVQGGGATLRLLEAVSRDVRAGGGRLSALITEVAGVLASFFPPPRWGDDSVGRRVRDFLPQRLQHLVPDHLLQEFGAICAPLGTWDETRSECLGFLHSLYAHSTSPSLTPTH